MTYEMETLNKTFVKICATFIFIFAQTLVFLIKQTSKPAEIF